MPAGDRRARAIRSELGAPAAQLDRVGFSPRLLELEAERKDVHLVLAEQLG